MSRNSTDEEQFNVLAVRPIPVVYSEHIQSLNELIREGIDQLEPVDRTKQIDHDKEQITILVNNAMICYQ